MSDEGAFDELDAYRREARSRRLKTLGTSLAFLVFLGACAMLWVPVGWMFAYASIAEPGHQQLSVRPVGVFTYAFSYELENGSCEGEYWVTPVSTRRRTRCSGKEILGNGQTRSWSTGFATE